MSDVHLILQSKGGVGKSFVASMLAQYFIDYKNSESISVADTDPMNATTGAIKRLNAEIIKIVENNVIIQSKFDMLFEAIMTNDHTFVIDSGSPTFLPIFQYFHDNEVLSLLEESEKRVYIHTVLVGGQSFADTLQCFKSIQNLIKGTNAQIVVWVNEFQGKILINGKDIASTNFFDVNSEGLAGAVRILDRNSDAFESSLKLLTEKSLTVAEVAEHPDFNLMSRSRLHRVFNDVYKQLDAITF